MTHNAKLPTVRASSKSRQALLLAGASAIASLSLAAPAMAASEAAFDSYSALAVAASDADQSAKLVPTMAKSKAAISSSAPDVQVETVRPAPVLSIGLAGAEKTIQRGTPARFIGYSNYPAFVERTELRIFFAGLPTDGTPHAVVSGDRNGVLEWTPSKYASAYMVYVYRVYDADGNYDETEAQDLTLMSAAHAMPEENPARADFGVQDSAAKRSIPLGSAVPVSVNGTADASALVRVSGQITPANAEGAYTAQQLIPPACNSLMVSVTKDCGSEQDISVSRADWQSPIVSMKPDEPPAALSQTISTSDGMTITIDPEEEQAIDNPYSVKVRTDQTHVDPVLAAGLVESERTVVRGQSATFISYVNYPSFVEKAEVRIFRAGVGPDATPLEVVPADKSGVARWTPGDMPEKDLFYTFRVYDEKGRFDETQPHELTVLDEAFSDAPAPVRPLFGTQDEAAIRNISFSKASTVTVTGTASPADEVVRVAGQVIPIEEDGRFVSQQIVDRDTKQIWVTVGPEEQAKFTAMRDIETKKDDWFIVGQGDLTLVATNGGAGAVEVSGNPITDGTNITSRAAFYAKGTLASGVKITSSLDTGETLLKDIFSNIDRKDPRQLLRRMDSNQYYTTYGDDSTLVEDAPTQGRFYLKVQKDKSSLLVGNFVADIQQAELAQLNRGVFGAIVDHKSMGTTEFGESKLQVTAFASDPGTIPGRDEFRGTGGSLYFLNRRDITVGSERLSIEVRDRDTGIVISRRDLRPQEDYDIDYFQGRVVLLRPLSSTASDGSVVREGSSFGNTPVLVARYEFTPAVGQLSGYTFGGRAAGWVGDTLRLGVTAQKETTDAADQTLIGADATVRIHAGTYAKAEFAQSDGPGFGQANSVDGGLSFTDLTATGVVGVKANAYRGEVAVDFAELRGATGDLGKVSAYYEHFDAGFSANGQLTPTETERFGAAINVPLGEATRVAAEYEQLETDGIGKRVVATGEIAQDLGTEVTLTAGVRHDEQASGLLNNSTQDGKRTDVALQLGYDPTDANWSVYGFGQMTIDRDATRQRNNRGGVGGKVEISDKVSASAEVSGGDGGLGANVELSHRYGDGSEMYLGYGLLTDRTDIGLEPLNALTQTNRGTLTLGARHRFSSALSINGENKIGHGGQAPSVVRSFGLNWDPSEHWSFSGSFENGRIDDAQTGEFKRTAATVGVGYTDEDVQLATNVEARFEEGLNRDQSVWLVRNTAAIQANPNWRVLGRLNFAIADTETNDVWLADYVEGTVGFAYRPVLNDRLNLLARYTYLQDLGPVGQITSGGEVAAPKQRSQIFSIDGNFDLTKTLTLGAKYAFRKGSVSLGRESDEFVSSNTQLGVLRLDWRLVKKWDFVAEAHYLTNDVGGDDKWGGIAAIYRHLGNNVKVGVGYSFSDFSTDLADQSYSSDGVFINLLGKF